MDIDKRIVVFDEWIRKRFKSLSRNVVSVSEGFVTASLLFCIGAMTIVGSLNAGLTGDNTMLFTKSVLALLKSRWQTICLQSL